MAGRQKKSRFLQFRQTPYPSENIEEDLLLFRMRAAGDNQWRFCLAEIQSFVQIAGNFLFQLNPGCIAVKLNVARSDNLFRRCTHLKNAIGILDKFNHVRNNDSLAHDNDLPDDAEARFIFDSIVAILRFLKSVEANRFGS